MSAARPRYTAPCRAAPVSIHTHKASVAATVKSSRNAYGRASQDEKATSFEQMKTTAAGKAEALPKSRRLRRNSNRLLSAIARTEGSLRTYSRAPPAQYAAQAT